MKRTLALFVAFVSIVALMQPDDADARRIGGGRSFGAQRSFTPAPSKSMRLPPMPSLATARGAPPSFASRFASRSGQSV